MQDTLSWRERRKRAREGMASGLLPLTVPGRTLGSTAQGECCAVCQCPIQPADLLFGLQLPSGPASAHSACVQAWAQECSDGVAAVPSPQATSPRLDITSG